MKIRFLLLPLLALTFSQSSVGREQGDQQTVVGTPPRSGEPVTLIEPGAGRQKAKSPAEAERQ